MTATDVRRAHDVFAEVLGRVTADQHDLPTPCASWSVRQLIEHVVGGSRFRVFRLGGENVAPDLTGDLVAELGVAASAEVDAFEAAADDQLVELPFGTIPAGVFVDIAAGDVVVHAWDLAKATGQSTDLAPDLCDALLGRLSDVLSDRLRGADGQAPFGVRRDAPEGASAADRFAAFTGRVV